MTHEALCCGLPALITRTAGIAERFPAELQDLLIPDPDDAAGLAERLRSWRGGGDRLAPALASFSASLRASTWDDMAARFLSIVEEAG